MGGLACCVFGVVLREGRAEAARGAEGVGAQRWLVTQLVGKHGADAERAGMGRWLPDELTGSIVCGALLVLSFALTHLVPGLGATGKSVGVALGWAALAVGMVYGSMAAWQALRQRKIDIDVLMVVAAGLAAAVGHPEDGALLLFLFTLAGALEDRAMKRTVRAVEALHKLMPTRAAVWRDGGWSEAEPRGLVVGDRVLVRAGESVPADARIVEGASSFDQAAITGESVPRTAGVGDEIFAGTINVGHPVEAVVSKRADESSLQRVLDLVTTAQQQREPMQRMIDRASEPYAIAVLALSAAVLLIWWLALGFGFVAAANVAIALLIVASPCALVIATPTATLAAISRAARAGLLFKGGQAIERLARLGSVALDKTGTLTRGRPRLLDVRVLAGDERAVLAAAMALESGSTHPIATAVVEACRARGISPPAVRELRDLPGRGLSGEVEIDGTWVAARLGTVEFAAVDGAGVIVDAARQAGRLGVVVNAGSAAGVLELADEIRAGAAAMVHDLHELGVRPIRMLTGDHAATAARVAAEVGIDRFDAGLLPEDKVRLLGEMRAEARAASSGRSPRGTGVIGDGVNDAPALAAADVSIAIGSIGADAALESADIVLLNDDLRVIPWGVRLARRTRAIVSFNIVFALGIIAFMATLTIVGSLWGFEVRLPWAVVAHEGGTLFVVANSLRLLLARGPGAS